jgi:hypothetical protein
MQSNASPPERRAQATSRDRALRRLRGLRWFVAALTLALVAGFAVLAYAATPPYQKKRHVEVALRSTPGSTTTKTHHRRQHRHHRRHQAQAAPVAPAPSAPQPAPVQPQPPAAAPTPTPQPPVTRSGGS